MWPQGLSIQLKSLYKFLHMLMVMEVQCKTKASEGVDGRVQTASLQGMKHQSGSGV